MSTGEPAGEGGGGGGDSTPCGDHSASTPGIGVQTGIQHPPPSPLSGCYLLVVLPEPHTAQHKDLILNRLAKGFLSWDKDSSHVDLEKELQALVAQAPEGEEARNGERLIQYATENLVTEVLIHPQTNTLLQCIRNLLASFTKHRHIIHAGYTFSGNGSWILQDGTFSLADFLDAFSEHEVQRVIRAYENSVTVDIHCAGVGDWTSSRLSKEACARSCRVRVNPDDVLTAGVPAISSFTEYLGQYLVAQTLDQLMEPSDVVGNIRFSHPTLYVFPGGQGDAALFGINGFNMLVDGGFARKACFWDFARHLDRLDAVLLTRVNNSNIGGMSSVLRKKQEMHVYPQIGHFFCNLVERRGTNSPDGDKDVDPLILNLTDLGQEMMVNLRHINLRAHPCYRDLDPINLYHKVGHGTLDMYVLSPSKDTREVREFLTKWQTSDSKLFAGSHKKDSNHLTFPIQNLVSICALLVWQPANPEDTITRILFPGSTPQNKIFEGLERLKHLEFMRHPICSAKSLSPSTSLATLKEKSNKQKTSIIEKSVDKDKDKDIKRVSDYRKDKKETLDTKTVKGVEESSPKPAAVPSAPIIPTKQPANVNVKAKKVVENKKIEKETKTDSKKIEKDLKEVKKEIVKREVVKIDKQDVETKKTDVVKTEIEKTAITKESKPKPEPKRKEIKETRTVVKTKVETQPKAAPKPSVDKKLKPSIDKKDVKSSPTTPKKIINGTASRTELTTKNSTKTTIKTASSRTVSAMPAKSAKDATNRKVVESKNLTTSSSPAAPAPKTPSVTAKPRSTDRKPISRRPKTGSPSKPRLSGSPAKSTRSTPPAPPKTEKDSVIRRPKVDKPATDASGLSTPSAVERESIVKLVDKSLTEKSDDISIDSIESKVLADLKEEREVVEEIEAVLSKAERNEIARKDDQLEGDDEITAEATDKKEDDVTEEDVTAEIEDVPKKVGSRKESQEFTEEDEYLIVEKEEIYTEDSALSGEGEQKHLLDEVESEKAKKYEVSKDLDVPEEDEEQKEKDEMEEKEKEEKRERKIQFHDKPEVGEITPAGLSQTRKEQLEEEVKDIIASATEMIQKTDERDDSGKKSSEDITKEPSSVSPDKFDSSEKKTDTDLKPEADQKEQVPEKLEESQDRISTLESGATTTAPTLPEDERITLDEIKEDVDEKHVKEEVKEKEIPQPVKDKLPEVPPPVPTAMMKSFVIRETVSTVQRDIVKTPDEVADLPVHEEVDPKLYDMDDYDKVKEEKVPQTPEAKEPPTPPVKEQKGMFSFFGKVADKFEKGMDKLTGKSKKDADKEVDEKSSKSSSPKETRPQDKTGFEEVDMGKVFAKVGKIEPHTADTFEKAKPQIPADIRVAAIKETAAFLQQEIKETKIDSVEPVIRTAMKPADITSEPKKPVEEINVAQKLDTAIDKPLDLTSKKEEILSEELVEDTKEVEALLEEASKKFVTVKDSLRDSLESLEDKIEDIVDDMRPIDAKDSIKSTLTGVAERLEDLKPQFDDTAELKEPNKVTFEIPKDGEEGEDDSDEYSGPVRDFKEAVRDVGEVLAGTAGIVIDDKPKDVVEIVKKVAEVLKEDNFLLEPVILDKPTPKDDEKPKDEKPEEPSHPKPIIEDIIMPKKVGVTEELPPQEEIEEMLEGGIARPLPAYERAGGIEVEEELCVKVVKDPKVDIKSPIKEAAPFGDDVKHLCSDLIDVVRKPAATPKPKVDDHEGKVDVMEAGIEEVCTKKEVKRELADDDDEIEDDQELEQSEILFQHKLAPAQAELVMVTPDSAPTSPKFSADKVYDKELEDAVAGVSKVPGVPKEIEEFISSKADVYDIIDEVIKKGRKITIEIIEYIVIVKKVSREHVIYIIEEIIINKGISPESVIEDVEILKSHESTNDLVISSVKRVEIEEYIVAEYIMKGKRITILTIEEIAIKKVVPKRIVIEIIEEIIIKRKISRESVYQMTEEEFVKEVKPIYDEFERQPRRESQGTVDHEVEPIVEAEKPKTIDEKPSLEALSADIIPAKVEEKSPKDDKPKSPVESQVPEPRKEKDAPIFDEKDLDEGKLIDDFVNISSKDAVMSFLHEERRLSHEEYNQAKQDSKPDSKIPVTDDTVKDLGDDFEAVEQEYKVHDVPTTTASTVHVITDLKDKEDVLEAVEDDLDDVIEAAEKFVEETKEKPEALKETSVTGVMASWPEKDSVAVTSETHSVPEVKDDKVPSKISDKATGDGASVVISEISIATEEYLDEDKEKTTTVTSESLKQPKDKKDILDDFEHVIKDTATLVSYEIQDIKDAVSKPDKPEPKIDEKDDHVGDKLEEKEAEHVADVSIKSPLDDKGDHPQLIVDVKTVTEKIDEPVEELKEKETAVSDAVTDKVPEKDSVKPETDLVPEVKDDKIQPETDKVIGDTIIPSGVTIATEKYLDEDKEKPTAIASESPKQPEDKPKVLDGIKDVTQVAAELHEIHDVKDTSPKLEKPELKPEEKKDLPKETLVDKHDVDTKDRDKELVHEEKGHMTDVTIRAPLDDKGRHPELTVDIESRISPERDTITDQIHETGDKVDKQDHKETKLDTVPDVPHEKEEVKDTAPKSDIPKPKTDEKDHPKKASPDKHEVDAIVGEEEPLHKEKAHMTDVTIRSPRDDAGHHPELKVDIETTGHKAHEPEEKGVKEDHIEAEEIVKPKPETGKEDSKEISQTPDVVDKTSQPEQIDKKTPEPTEIKKIPSEDSLKDAHDSPDDVKKSSGDVKQKTDEVIVKDTFSKVTDVKILDTSEIVDLKQFEIKVDEKKDDKETDKISKETKPASPSHAAEPTIPDSSCFNIGKLETHTAPIEESPLDVHDKSDDELDKLPKHPDVHRKDTELDDAETEPDHSIRKKRSLGEDVIEPEEFVKELKDTVRKSVDFTLSVTENDQTSPKDLAPLSVEPEGEKPDDDDDKEVGTVRRMVVTASSEDGGHEIELCPTGSITFGKSVTPDDSLKDISTKSTPDKDSLQLEKDSLYSGKSSPEKDSISEKSLSDLKDDKGTPEDSLEKSITGVHSHVVVDDGRRKSHVEEPKETKPAVLGEVASKIPKDMSHELPDKKVPEKPKEEVSAKPTETTPAVPEKPVVAAPEKLEDKASEKPKETIPEKVAEKLPHEVLDKPTEKVPDTKPAEVSAKLTENIPEKPTDIPGLKSPETAPSEDISQAETVFDKSPTDKSADTLSKEPTDSQSRSPSLPSEKLDHVAPGDKFEHPPIVPIVPEEHDASRKSSIASVKPEEADTLVDKDHKAESPSSIKDSNIVSEKLDDKVSLVEAKKDKSPSPISEKTTDKPDEKEPKEKSPSPEVREEKEMPKTPNVTPEDDKHPLPADKMEEEKSPSPTTDKLTEEKMPTDKSRSEISPLPTSDKDSNKPRSPPPTTDKVLDQSRTPSITPEKVDEKDVTDDKVHKDKSPSPIPDDKIETGLSINSVKHEEVHISAAIVQKDGSPSPVEPAEKSRTPRIVSEKLSDKDALEDKNKSATPKADKTTDRPRTPEKAHDENVIVGADKSRSPSIASEKPGLEDFHELTTQKDKSPSPIADEKLDKSRTPSITPEKLTEQVELDDKVHKDKSPSPTPSLTSDKPGEKEIHELKDHEDKPEEKPDRSRTSSIASVKPEDQITPHGEVQKERSPSPVTDDKSRKPSIVADKPEAKDIPDGTGQKDKSPSPAVDEVPDKSRAPSIVSDKLTEHLVPDDKVSGDKSPSPITDGTTDKSRSLSVTLEKSDVKDITGSISMVPDLKDAVESIEHKDKTPSPAVDEKSPVPGHVLPDDKAHKDKSPSPTPGQVGDKSRTPSIVSEERDEKRLSSPATEKETDEKRKPSMTPDILEASSPKPEDVDKSRKPSIISDKIDDKDVPHGQVQKERSPSPATHHATGESKKPGIVSDGEVHKDRSPSPTVDKVTDKSRSPSVTSEKPDEKIPVAKEQKDKSPSPMADDKLDRHSRTSSISSVKLEDKDIPDDNLHNERSPSPASDKVTDKSRSPSIATEKPDEKIPESKSPMIDEKTDLDSRTSSISSVKLDDKDIPDDKLHKERSPSPAADKVADKSRSSSITSEKPDENATLDRHSRSLSPAKLDEKDIPDDKLTKDKSPSPSIDEVTVPSRTPSIVPEKQDEHDVPVAQVPKDKSPSPTPDVATERSRTSSIVSDKPEGIDTSDIKVQKDGSPSPPGDKVTEKPDGKTTGHEIPKDRSPSPVAYTVTEKTETLNITHEKLDTAFVQTDKSPKDQSPTQLDHGEPAKPEETSVVGGKTDEKSRSPSIVSEKLDDKHIPSLEHPKDKSPSPSTDKSVDQSKVTSPPDHKPEEKVPRPVGGKLDEKSQVSGAIDDTTEKEKSPSPISEVSDKIRSPSLSSEEPEEKALSPIGEKVEDKKPDQKIEKDRSPSPVIVETADKSRSPSIASDKTVVKELTEKPKSPTAADEKPAQPEIVAKDSGDKIDTTEKSKSPLGDAPKKEVTDVSKSPDLDEDKPEEVTDKKTTGAKSPVDVSKPVITSGKPDDIVTVGQKTDESPTSPSPLGEKPEKHSETIPSVEKPKTLDIGSTELADEPKDKSRSSSLMSDRSKSPSVIDDKHDDSRKSSRASAKSEPEEQVDSLKSSVPSHELGEKKDIHKSLSDGSLPEEPKSPGAVSDKFDMRDTADSKSPRDRSPSYDRTPKDRSRSHSLFDTGDKTPLGRSRAASLFDDKLDDKIALLDFDGHSMRPSISEEIEEDRLPVKDDDSKSGTKSPSVGDRESPVSKEDELPASKRLEIELYIIDEFITKKRKITSQIIEEIVIKKSVSRYIIIEIIEEIIVKLKIRRESVIDVADIDEPKDDHTDVKDKQSVLETPEDKPAVAKDTKPEESVSDSKRPSIAGKTSPVHDVDDEKKPRGSVTAETFDLKITESRKSSTGDDLVVELVPHVIKKRSIGDEFLEPKTTEPEKVEPGKDDSPKPDGIDAKRPSIADEKHPQPEATEIEPAKIPEAEAPRKPRISSEKLPEFDTLKESVGATKKPEDQAKPDAKVIPTVVAKTEEGKEIHPEGFEEEVVTVTDAKRTEIEDYIVEEYIKRGRKITREIVEEIVIRKAVPRYIILEIIEEIIIKRKISRVSVIDFVEEEVTDKEDARSTTSSISDKDDIKLRKLSEDRFDITGKSTPEISSAKDQTIDFSGKSTPDLKSSLLSEKYSDKSGYSTPDMKQFDERSGKSTPDYRTEYESQFHKAFVGGMTEMRTTHITTLSGKSTPDFGAGREDTPEPKSESQSKPDAPAGKSDAEVHDSDSVPAKHEVDAVPIEEAPGKSSEVPTTNQSIFASTISGITKATSELATKFSESTTSSVSTVTSKILPSHPEPKTTDQSGPEGSKPPSTVEKTKTPEGVSEPEIIAKVIKQEGDGHKPSEPEVITTAIKHVTEPEVITKVIKRELETHEPSDIATITKTVKHVTEIEESEPEIITKGIKRESLAAEDGTTISSTLTTVTKRFEVESEPEEEEEVITRVIRREIETSEPSETEVITRTVRHVTEIEEGEPEILTKVSRREIFVSDDEEDVITTTKTSRVTEYGDSETSETSETVTKTVKSTESHPEVVKRIISREGAPELTETVTTRTTRTIVSETGHPTETTTKTTTTTSNSDIEKPELITRIISREGTPEISETIKRTTKTISSDTGPEYVTRIISREGTPDIVKTSEVKRIVTTVTTVTGPDGESVTTKDVKESSDKLDDEDLLEKLIDSSSSEKSQKSGPDVETSEERFVSETPDGLVTEEIMKRTVTTVTSTSGTSTPDVKTFIDSGKSTPDHKEEEKIAKPDKPTPEPSKDSNITAEKTAPEIPTSHLLKDLVTEDKTYSGKSTPDIPASPLIKDSASISGRILSGRSTPDRKSDGKSRTATPEGFRSGEVIRTIITTTRTMSEDGEIITTTKEVTESTDDQGQTTILEEKTDVKRDDKLPGRDAAETAISSVIGNIRASELKRGSSPGSDVMSDRDFGPMSPRSDISSGHSRAATHVWGSSEERHTYSDDDPPSSPLSATSQFGYSPQLPRYELPFDKDAHKPGEAPGSMMTGSFYGELPSEPTTTSSAKATFMSATTTSKNSEPIPIKGEHLTKRFTVEKEFAGGYDYRSETKKYVDDADLDFDRAMMEHREKRGEDLVSHHYSNGSSSVVYTNGNTREKSMTTTTVEKTSSSGDKKKQDPMAASFSAEKEPEEGEKSGKDPLEGWGKPLFLPSPKPPRKFNLQRPVASTSSEELNPESLNFDVINNWGEPLRLPSPAPAPAPTNEVSNKGAPGTPKKERKQPKKVVSENNKNKKRSESPSKNDKKSKDSKNKVQPVYMDLTYVPHHGNSYYSSLEFFKRIRARYYVFSGTEPSREVYDALLEAKKTWEDKNLEVTMIPTYDTDTLGYWVADNEEALAANHIDLSPSASRCTINLQDHETSCSAYRLEF